jgi:cytochrome c-type biogenesis protein CcsB
MRWRISGHAPWSDGYESMLLISWATILAGIIFSKRSSITLAVTSIFSFLILYVAHLSWMDPEITNLVPVLKSYWLIIHVAVITSSYALFGIISFLGIINLAMMAWKNSKNADKIEPAINELTCIIEIALISGLYLLATGTILGGVWANESWGRYWGWDPKETWTLITIIVYAFIAHMRLIPGLKSVYLFNLMSVLGFGSVIMTYFGVNYYLSGLHSYARGELPPIPFIVYVIPGFIFGLAILAYLKHKKISY